MRKAASVAIVIGLALALWSPASGASNGNDIIQLTPPEGAPMPDAFGTAHLVGFYIDGENPHWDSSLQVWMDAHKLERLTGDLMYTMYITIGSGDPVRLVNFNTMDWTGNSNAMCTCTSLLEGLFDDDITIDIAIHQDGANAADGVVVLTGTIERP